MIAICARPQIDKDAAAQGARARWTTYWTTNERPVFYFLLRLTFGDWAEAEDHLQETFLRAWRWLEAHPDEPEPLRSWLFTIARRIVIDTGRARQARPPETFNMDLTDVEGRRDEIERFVETQSVRMAMRDLRPLYREALFEVYYRERTIAEAAVILGVPEGTVKSRVHNALRYLRTVVRNTSDQSAAEVLQEGLPVGDRTGRAPRGVLRRLLGDGETLVGPAGITGGFDARPFPPDVPPGSAWFDKVSWRRPSTTSSYSPEHATP